MDYDIGRQFRCTLFEHYCVIILSGRYRNLAIYLLLMLRSVGSAFHAPAMKSSIPLLAPEKELTRIASINQTIQALCNICGPVLGAALIVSTNMSVVMLLDVAGAAIACTTLMFVFIPNPEKTETETTNNVLRDMKEGFQAICSNCGLKWGDGH